MKEYAKLSRGDKVVLLKSSYATAKDKIEDIDFSEIENNLGKVLTIWRTGENTTTTEELTTIIPLSMVRLVTKVQRGGDKKVGIKGELTDLGEDKPLKLKLEVNEEIRGKIKEYVVPDTETNLEIRGETIKRYLGKRLFTRNLESTYGYLLLAKDIIDKGQIIIKIDGMREYDSIQSAFKQAVKDILDYEERKPFEIIIIDRED